MMTRPRHARPARLRNRVAFTAAALSLPLVVTPAALAHNHVANPSGVCNNSGMGTSPGNSGEGFENPGGKTVGRAQAGAFRSNCP